MALSTRKILDAVLDKIHEFAPKVRGNYLDIGAGHGALVRRVSQEFEVTAFACDYTSRLMRNRRVRVDVVDLNTDALPYPDATFALVTCTEVIEHLEHYRETIREIFRILQPGGVVILTTPNVLNLRSRVRYLLFGFFSVFGPLHMRESELYLTGGHINPVSYFYIAHALGDAGFIDVSPSIDRRQRGSAGWLILWWLPVRLYCVWALGREKSRYQTVNRTNEQFVRQMNSVDLLTGRTLVVAARKRN